MNKIAAIKICREIEQRVSKERADAKFTLKDWKDLVEAVAIHLQYSYNELQARYEALGQRIAAIGEQGWCENLLRMVEERENITKLLKGKDI